MTWFPEILTLPAMSFDANSAPFKGLQKKWCVIRPWHLVPNADGAVPIRVNVAGTGSGRVRRRRALFPKIAGNLE